MSLRSFLHSAHTPFFLSAGAITLSHTGQRGGKSRSHIVACRALRIIPYLTGFLYKLAERGIPVLHMIVIYHLLYPVVTAYHDHTTLRPGNGGI